MPAIALFFLTGLVEYLLPWWTAFFPAMAVGFWMCRSAPGAFIAGFLGAGASWLALALFLNKINGGILAAKVAAMFSLPASWMPLLVTFILGGFLGGFSAWTGFNLKMAVGEWRIETWKRSRKAASPASAPEAEEKELP